jgi:Xaa-Pro aminopeptidase
MVNRSDLSLGFTPGAQILEVREKLQRVATLLGRHGADGLRLQRAENLAWISGGGDFRINREGNAIAEALVTRDGVHYFTDRIERERLASEELPAWSRITAVDWFTPGARAEALLAAAPGRLLDDLELDLATTRQPLLAIERARLAAVGASTSRALTDIAHTLRPNMSERQVAAAVQGAVRHQQLEVPVCLVAGESRLGGVRHPLPTDAPFGAVGMIVVCASRFGVVASLTRLIAFGEAPQRVVENLAKVWEVEAAMLTASRPGVPTNAVLEAAQAAYAALGMGEAWRDHHQGGPACYAPRSWLATPTELRPLESGMPLAWNPSLPWAKSEDTFMLDGDELTNLTWDARWPSVSVAGRPRATVLVL